MRLSQILRAKLYASLCVYAVFMVLCAGFRVGFLAWHGEWDALALGIGARLDMGYCAWAGIIYLVLAWGSFSRIVFDILAIFIVGAQMIFVVFFSIFARNIDGMLMLLIVEPPLKLANTAINQDFGILPAVLCFVGIMIVLIRVHEWILRRFYQRANGAKIAGAAAAAGSATNEIRQTSASNATNEISLDGKSVAITTTTPTNEISLDGKTTQTSANNTKSPKLPVVLFALMLGAWYFGLSDKERLRLTPSQHFHSTTLDASAHGHIHGLVRLVREKIYSDSFDRFDVGSPKDAFCQAFDCQRSMDIYEHIKHTKSTAALIKPRRIYYIVHESLSDWALRPRFAAIAPQLQALAQKGAYIPAINNATSTRESMWAQLLGTHYDGYNDFSEDFAGYDVRTNLAANARALGYETRFYYGGRDEWMKLRNLGKIINMQISTQKNIIKKYAIHAQNSAQDGSQDGAQNSAQDDAQLPPEYANTWGLYDDYVYGYVDDMAKDGDLSVIMTITHHPPYDLGVFLHDDMAVPWEQIDAISTKYRNELATLYWSQRRLVEWVERTALAHPDSLFIIVGDHYGRYNVDESSDIVLNNTVPLIVYYPLARIYGTCTVASHLDIMASIVGLIAPAGYEYYSFGRECFALDSAASRHDEMVIGTNVSYLGGFASSAFVGASGGGIFADGVSAGSVSAGTVSGGGFGGATNEISLDSKTAQTSASNERLASEASKCKTPFNGCYEREDSNAGALPTNEILSDFFDERGYGRGVFDKSHFEFKSAKEQILRALSWYLIHKGNIIK